MCGIMGVLNSDKVKDVDLGKYMNDGLIVGAVRGQDATGLYQVKSPTKASEVTFYKTAEFGNEFVRNNRARQLIDATPGSFLTVGHNRAATVGGTARNAAHPFLFDISTKKNEDLSFVGVHNGTLSKWYHREDNVNFVSDSEWALWQIASYGAEKVIPEFEGAFAFAFYDQRRPTQFNLYTNGLRPLHFAFVQQRDTILIASEAEMLHWLAARNNLTLEKQTILTCQRHILYRFDTAALRDYERIILAPKPTPITTSTHTYRPSSPVLNEAFVKELVNKLLAEVGQKTKVIATADKPRITAETMSKKDPSVSTEDFMFLTTTLAIPANAEAYFEMESYDPVAKIMHGTTTIAIPVVTMSAETDFETFDAQMRNVTKEEAAEMANNPDFWPTRALGAFIRPHLKKEALDEIGGDDDEPSPVQDVIIVVSKPIKENVPANA